MGVLSVSLTFVGYLLVYAAVANHGQFSGSPWMGVLADAYDGTPATAATPPAGGPH